jgi:hypothetical protein
MVAASRWALTRSTAGRVAVVVRLGHFQLPELGPCEVEDGRYSLGFDAQAGSDERVGGAGLIQPQPDCQG